MNVLFVLGILVAIALVDRVGRIRLQTVGFVGCAAGRLPVGASVLEKQREADAALA